MIDKDKLLEAPDEESPSEAFESFLARVADQMQHSDVLLADASCTVRSEQVGNGTLLTISDFGGKGQREQRIEYDSTGSPLKFEHLEPGARLIVEFQGGKVSEIRVNGEPVQGPAGDRLLSSCAQALGLLSGKVGPVEQRELPLSGGSENKSAERDGSVLYDARFIPQDNLKMGENLAPTGQANVEYDKEGRLHYFCDEHGNHARLYYYGGRIDVIKTAHCTYKCTDSVGNVWTNEKGERFEGLGRLQSDNFDTPPGEKAKFEYAHVLGKLGIDAQSLIKDQKVQLVKGIEEFAGKPATSGTQTLDSGMQEHILNFMKLAHTWTENERELFVRVLSKAECLEAIRQYRRLESGPPPEGLLSTLTNELKSADNKTSDRAALALVQLSKYWTPEVLDRFIDKSAREGSLESFLRVSKQDQMHAYPGEFLNKLAELPEPLRLKLADENARKLSDSSATEGQKDVARLLLMSMSKSWTPSDATTFAKSIDANSIKRIEATFGGEFAKQLNVCGSEAKAALTTQLRVQLEQNENLLLKRASGMVLHVLAPSWTAADARSFAQDFFKNRDAGAEQVLKSIEKLPQAARDELIKQARETLQSEQAGNAEKSAALNLLLSMPSDCNASDVKLLSRIADENSEQRINVGNCFARLIKESKDKDAGLSALQVLLDKPWSGVNLKDFGLLSSAVDVLDKHADPQLLKVLLHKFGLPAQQAGVDVSWSKDGYFGEARVFAGALLTRLLEYSQTPELRGEALSLLSDLSWPLIDRENLGRAASSYVRDNPGNQEIAKQASRVTYDCYHRPDLESVLRQYVPDSFYHHKDAAQKIEQILKTDTESGDSVARRAFARIELINGLPAEIREELTGSKDKIDAKQFVDSIRDASIRESKYAFLLEPQESPLSIEQKFQTKLSECAARAEQALTAYREQVPEVAAFLNSLTKHTKEGAGWFLRDEWAKGQEAYVKLFLNQSSKLKNLDEGVQNELARYGQLSKALVAYQFTRSRDEGRMAEADVLAMKMQTQHGSAKLQAEFPSMWKHLTAGSVIEAERYRNGLERLADQLGVNRELSSVLANPNRLTGVDRFKELKAACEKCNLPLPIEFERLVTRELETAMKESPRLQKLQKASEVFNKYMPQLQELVGAAAKGSVFEGYQKTVQELSKKMLKELNEAGIDPQELRQLQSELKTMRNSMPVLFGSNEDMKRAQGAVSRDDLQANFDMLEKMSNYLDPQTEDGTWFKEFTQKAENMSVTDFANWCKTNLPIIVACTVAALATGGILGAAGFSTWVVIGGSAAAATLAGDLTKGVLWAMGNPLGLGDRGDRGHLAYMFDKDTTWSDWLLKHGLGGLGQEYVMNIALVLATAGIMNPKVTSQFIKAISTGRFEQFAKLPQVQALFKNMATLERACVGNEPLKKVLMGKFGHFIGEMAENLTQEGTQWGLQGLSVLDEGNVLLGLAANIATALGKKGGCRLRAGRHNTLHADGDFNEVIKAVSADGHVSVKRLPTGAIEVRRADSPHGPCIVIAPEKTLKVLAPESVKESTKSKTDISSGAGKELGPIADLMQSGKHEQAHRRLLHNIEHERRNATAAHFKDVEVRPGMLDAQFQEALQQMREGGSFHVDKDGKLIYSRPRLVLTLESGEKIDVASGIDGLRGLERARLASLRESPQVKRLLLEQNISLIRDGAMMEFIDKSGLSARECLHKLSHDAETRSRFEAELAARLESAGFSRDFVKSYMDLDSPEKQKRAHEPEAASKGDQSGESVKDKTGESESKKAVPAKDVDPMYEKPNPIIEQALAKEPRKTLVENNPDLAKAAEGPFSLDNYCFGKEPWKSSGARGRVSLPEGAIKEMDAAYTKYMLKLREASLAKNETERNKLAREAIDLYEKELKPTMKKHGVEVKEGFTKESACFEIVPKLGSENWARNVRPAPPPQTPAQIKELFSKHPKFRDAILGLPEFRGLSDQARLPQAAQERLMVELLKDSPMRGLFLNGAKVAAQFQVKVMPLDGSRPFDTAINIAEEFTHMFQKFNGDKPLSQYGRDYQQRLENERSGKASSSDVSAVADKKGATLAMKEQDILGVLLEFGIKPNQELFNPSNNYRREGVLDVLGQERGSSRQHGVPPVSTHGTEDRRPGTREKTSASETLHPVEPSKKSLPELSPENFGKVKWDGADKLKMQFEGSDRSVRFNQQQLGNVQEGFKNYADAMREYQRNPGSIEAQQKMTEAVTKWKEVLKSNGVEVVEDHSGQDRTRFSLTLDRCKITIKDPVLGIKSVEFDGSKKHLAQYLRNLPKEQYLQVKQELRKHASLHGVLAAVDAETENQFKMKLSAVQGKVDSDTLFSLHSAPAANGLKPFQQAALKPVVVVPPIDKIDWKTGKDTAGRDVLMVWFEEPLHFLQHVNGGPLSKNGRRAMSQFDNDGRYPAAGSDLEKAPGFQKSGRNPAHGMLWQEYDIVATMLEMGLKPPADAWTKPGYNRDVIHKVVTGKDPLSAATDHTLAPGERPLQHGDTVTGAPHTSLDVASLFNPSAIRARRHAIAAALEQHVTALKRENPAISNEQLKRSAEPYRDSLRFEGALENFNQRLVRHRENPGNIHEQNAMTKAVENLLDKTPPQQYQKVFQFLVDNGAVHRGDLLEKANPAQLAELAKSHVESNGTRGLSLKRLVGDSYTYKAGDLVKAVREHGGGVLTIDKLLDTLAADRPEMVETVLKSGTLAQHEMDALKAKCEARKKAVSNR